MLDEKTIEVLPLFPLPLFTCLYTDGDLGETISFLDSREMRDGGKAKEYGLNSEDTYILDHPECKLLADFIKQAANYFAKEILLYVYEDYVFSQSWVSYKMPNQLHTIHTHPNSLISGVFYYGEYDSDIPAIKFHRPIFSNSVSYLSPKYQADRRKSQYAWDTFSVNPSEGLLILFPSYVAHSVPLNTSNKVRKSLAFNIMSKGRIGDENTLTELLFHRAI